MTVRIVRSCGSETETTFPVTMTMSAITNLLFHEGIVAIEIVEVSR